MMKTAALATGAFVVAAAGLTPASFADPAQFPDLRSYPTVNSADFTTYSAYMTSGVQFTAPAGYRCRMSFTHKQNGAHMECWGTLPATPDNNNYVALNYLGLTNSPPAFFSTIDLSTMDIIPATAGYPRATLTAKDYKSLPPHTTVTYTDGPLQRCGADSSMTACELIDDQGQRHGFVLSPQGSWTF